MSSIYIFYGKSGSGKGTQGHLLHKYLEQNNRTIIYIEAGKIFRDFIAKEKSFTAHCVAETMNTGKLLPAFFPIYTWAKELIEKYTGTEDIICDSTTRRLDEMEIFLPTLDFYRVSNIHVIVLNISDEEAILRIHNRHEGRVDDIDNTSIHNRLQWYTDSVVPVIDFCRNTPGVQVHDIDGIGSVDEIFERIKKAVF